MKFLDYRKYLESEFRLKGKRKKGEETRDLLMMAAADCLNDGGIHGLTVADMCKQAGIAHSTYYLYFKNRKEVTIELLKDFMLTLGKFFTGVGGQDDAFDAIYLANLQWLKSIRMNAGLHRCTLQLMDEEGEFAAFMNEQNEIWYDKVARSVARRYAHEKKVDPRTIRLSVYALGSMMDEICRKIVIYPDENLINLAGEIVPNDDHLAEFVSVIWYKTLYGQDAPESLSSEHSRSLLKLELSRDAMKA